MSLEKPPKRKSAEEVRHDFESKLTDPVEAAELKAFANGEQNDMTLDATWTEDELRALAKQIVTERGA